MTAARPLLLIGNKRYSSWSLRPWLYLRHHEIDFEERRVPLYQPESKGQILAISPSGKVPALVDGALVVWDSLAILEYAAERFADTRGWPEDRADRARARSVSAEMHSGFFAMREHLSMNCVKRYAWREWPEGVLRDAERVQALWADCLTRSGGPFLFGPFGIADAMYAPVVWRFVGYSVPKSEVAQRYCETMLALPAMRQWESEARAEPERLPQFERDDLFGETPR